MHPNVAAIVILSLTLVGCWTLLLSSCHIDSLISRSYRIGIWRFSLPFCYDDYAKARFSTIFFITIIVLTNLRKKNTFCKLNIQSTHRLKLLFPHISYKKRKWSDSFITHLVNFMARYNVMLYDTFNVPMWHIVNYIGWDWLASGDLRETMLLRVHPANVSAYRQQVNWLIY